MRKIVIIGPAGSGKSTLAEKLAHKIGGAYVDLDQFHHLPGWKERGTEDFCRLVDAATRGDTWAVAGNYTTRAQPIIRPRADTLIWLDMPFWANLWQLFRRTLKRVRTGESICNGNRETIAKSFFSKDSILWWFLTTWAKNRKNNRDLFARPQDYPHLQMIRLRSYAESAQLLESVNGGAAENACC